MGSFEGGPEHRCNMITYLNHFLVVLLKVWDGF